MKTRPERHTYLFAIAAVMIAGSLGLYCLLFLKWMGGGSSAAPFAPKAPAPAPERLADARARFRDGFLDPSARLRLAEALYALGRTTDAFYVMKETREFFGAESFGIAREAVILRKDSVASIEDQEIVRKTEQSSGTEALKDVGAALAQHPEDQTLLLLKADLTAKSDLLGAVPLYARLANAGPSSFEGKRALDALSRLARKKESDAQSEAGRLAQEALQELYTAHPKEPAVFAALATAAWDRGEASAARALVADALRKDPSNPGALRVDALAALGDGDAERAAKQFSAAWRRDPDDLFSAGQLARLYDRERGDPETALPYYIALYRGGADAAGSRAVEQRIEEILDARRKALVGRVGADSLGRFLSDDDGSLRAEACARAGEAKDAQWVDALADLLDDDLDIVRHNADYALYQIASQKPEAVLAHKDAWLASPRLLLRTRALNLFADLYGQETLPAVVAALHDPQPSVRFLAKTMVLDHYYKADAAARRAADDYLSKEKDPAVLALYARAGDK